MNYEKKKKALELGIYGSMTQRRSYITQPMDLDDPANRSFWTRNRTECLLRLLTEQAQLTGDIDHESVADKMTALLSLPIAMKKQNISDRLEAMFAKYQWEQSRSQASGSKANWIWNEQLQYIIELLQERESNEDEKSPVQKIKTEHPSPSVIVINDDSSAPVAVSSPQKTPHSSISIPEVKPLIAVQESSTSSASTLAKKTRSEPELRPKEALKIGIKGTQQIITPHPSLLKASPNIATQSMVIAVKPGTSEPILIPLSDAQQLSAVFSGGANVNTLKVSTDTSIATATFTPTITTSPVASRASVIVSTPPKPIIVSDSSHGKVSIAPKRATPEDDSADGRSKRTIRPPQNHLNLLTGDETRTRMPDLHVHYMLKMYRQYLSDRMLTSGRLSKGTFNEIANDLNVKFSVNYYEREQVASKLQNLKTQYRQRRVGVAEGNVEELSWKWYKEMQEILTIESNARKDSKDGGKKLPFQTSNSDESSVDSSSLKIEAFSENPTETPPMKKRRGRPKGSVNGSRLSRETTAFFAGMDRTAEEFSYTQKIKPRPEKVLLDAEMLKDTVTDMAEQKRETRSGTEDPKAAEARKLKRLKEVKEELHALRAMSFELFQSTTQLLRSIEE